jgi:hypothetical protein
MQLRPFDGVAKSKIAKYSPEKKSVCRFDAGALPVSTGAQFNSSQAKRLKFGNRPFRHQKRTGLRA